jgi:hypothetical protein
VSTSRTLTAGAGLTGGGDLSADRSFAVGAGNGIQVNPNDVALASSVAGNGLTYSGGVLTVGAGSGISVGAANVSVDIASQTDLGTAPADTDELLINDGGVIKKVAVSDLLTNAGSPTYSVEKSANEDVTSSTTLQNDNELVISNVETGFYRISALLLVRDVAVSGAGFKFDFALTGYSASNTVCRAFSKLFSGAGAASFDEVGVLTDNFDNISLETGSGTTKIMVDAVAEVTLGTNSIQLRWAQHTSDPDAIRVEAGSWLGMQKL